MADTYTTEAIACGLSDVAGWLENEGGREVIAAARAEYDRWSTGGDTSRPAGERNWACRQNDNGTWAITTYHQHYDEADRARHEQALAAAISVAVPASLAALGTREGSGADGLGDGRAICEALGFDPTNHHNAERCPYCNPNGWTLRPHPQAPNTLSEVEEARAHGAAVRARLEAGR